MMNAMQTAFQKAGRNTGLDRLYALTTTVAAQCNGDVVRVARRVADACLNDSEMRFALAEDFARRAVNDMKGLPGEGLPFRAQLGLASRAHARQTNDDAAGLASFAQQGPSGSARPSSTEREGVSADPMLPTSGLSSHAAPPPTDRGRAGPEALAIFGQTTSARPAREPTEGQRRAMVSVAKKAALTVLDTYQVQGRIIGDIQYGDLPAMKARGAREGALLDLLMNETNPGNPHIRVRDYLDAETVQRMIQRAAEMADAA